MLNLLRADLYRITRISRLRGAFWQYALVLTACTALFAFTTSMSLQEGVLSVERARMCSTPSAFAGGWWLSSPSILTMSCLFGALELLFFDLSDGYIKNLISSTRGRLALFVEKLVLVGLWSFLLMVVSFALIALLALFLMSRAGLSFTALDTVGTGFLWVLGVWLTNWAISAIPLFFAFASRAKVPSYIFAFLIATSSIPLFLMSLVESGLLGLPDPLQSLLFNVAGWMPTIAMQNLATGANCILNPMTDSAGLPLNFATWILLVGIIWLTISSALFLLVAKKKDL